MSLDLDTVLGGFDGEEPSGPDLEYDAAFSDLAIAATAKGEQQVGDKVIEAEDADYAEVVKLGEALLEKTMDLRIAVYLAEAGLNRHGYPYFAQVLDYIRRALQDYWDTVHPQLDADDDNDPTERVNALVGLVDDDTVLRQLRRAPLSESKMMGRFSLRHVSVAKGEIVAPADMDNPPDMAAVGAALKDTPEEDMTAIRESISAALEHTAAIDAILAEHVPGQGPDFAPLQVLLKSGQAVIAECLGESAPLTATGETAEGDGATDPQAGGASGGGGVSGINSTNDVLRAMDLMLDYYARNEPSSPVPIFIKRAKRLVSADFITIMKDMASSGIAEVATIGGLSSEEYE
ncbi:type VI secretion system protein TssA [Neptunicoccus sediminis]|uniref:type VI secretion system protein TssA n=1 Tax=Neptunicoccus sediminis TaxID=1892596 RepID=UPI000A474E2A|nr:type VI secretion system protein TssA [Neptunicoccus sediminis]